MVDPERAAARAKQAAASPRKSGDPQTGGGNIDGTEFLVGYAPGMQPQRFDLGDGAKLIPAGSDLVLQLHYTADGTAATDVTRIGLVMAKGDRATGISR